MEPNWQPAPGNVPGITRDRALEQHRVLRNTYLLLAVTLVPTAIGAVIGTNLNLSFMRSSPIIASLVFLGIFYGWIYAIERNRDSGLGVGLLLGFTLFMGLMLGPLLQGVLGLRNGAQLVMMAAGGTAAVFFGLSAVASTTTRDFSSLTNFLVVGSIVFMLAVFANIFLASPVLHLVLLSVVVLLSSLIILWKINGIVHGGEPNYISATLTLYVALWNMFSALLQLLGIFGGDRD